MSRVAVLVLLLALGGGCQYANARLRDAADGVAASVTVGPGFMVDAQATWLARVGGGYLQGQRYALYYGRPSHFSETFSSLIAFAPLLSIEMTENHPGGSSPWITTAVFMPVALGPDGGSHANPLYSPVYGLQWRYRRGQEELLELRTACGNGYMDTGLNLHLFLLGVEFRIKVAEIIDFFAGFTTPDMMGDDIRAYPAGPALEETEVPEKRLEEK